MKIHNKTLGTLAVILLFSGLFWIILFIMTDFILT